jgi:hypothetical protein
VSEGWHPRDELSALLDGELPDELAERIEVHCLVCSTCALELDAARHARRDLRFLPAVEPPPGFLDGLLVMAPVGAARSTDEAFARQRPGWWLGNAAIAAVLGLALVLGTSGGAGGTASASVFVGDAVHQHSLMTAALGDTLDGSYASPPRVDDLRRPYVAPAELAGYRLVDAFEVFGGVQLLYERGSDGLSVFETRGSADRRSDVYAGHPVEVVSRDGVVLTIVGSGLDSPVRQAADELDGGASSATRLRRACGDVLQTLSPAG